jgi:hypothetical protein
MSGGLMDEAELLEKLRLINALYLSASTDAERIAAGETRRRILNRLKSIPKEEPLVVHRFLARK